MGRRPLARSWAAAAVAALGLAIGLAACGDEPEPASEIAVARAAAPATLDPALVADHDTMEAVWLVHTPLLTYRHAEGESGMELIPGLASDLPEISADGRTYRLTLRDELTYSDGTPAVASDFERAVERARTLGSPASPYLREIAAIDTDDTSGTITIRLTRPDVTFASVLAMPATAPVPPGPGTPPGIGPYELSGEAGGAITLTRSETFADFDIPDIPRGNIDRITISVVPDARERTLQVLDGELDSLQGPPASDLEPQISREAGDRYLQSPAASTTYAFLDPESEPFDDPSVREAVALGIDSTGCSLIPPGMTGYDHDFDTTGCAPDLDAARALIREAGAVGTAVKVSGTETDDYLRQLRAIGLDPRPGGRATSATELVSQQATISEPFEFFDRVADEPRIAAELNELRRDPDAVAGWLALERYVLTSPQNYLVPLAHERESTLFAPRLDPGSAVVHPLFGNDFTSWRLAEGK